MKAVHVPILTERIVGALIEPFLALPDGSDTHWLLDCTLGGGGHTGAFVEAFSKNQELEKHKILAIDKDPRAIERGLETFAREIQEGDVEIAHSSFCDLPALIEGKAVLGLLADLGFSSDQMQDAARGFSFQLEGPLDMRMDPTSGRSCQELLAEISEPELEHILREHGEERFSRRIAAAIIENRYSRNLPSTTRELAEIVVRAIPASARHGRIHAATRTFQALRIEVNEEMKQLDCLLNDVAMRVKPGGRIAILSFHSLEDRKVKHAFRGPGFEPLTKKPIVPDEGEIRANPRSRSAKLRVAERA